MIPCVEIGSREPQREIMAIDKAVKNTQTTNWTRRGAFKKALVLQKSHSSSDLCICGSSASDGAHNSAGIQINFCLFPLLYKM